MADWFKIDANILSDNRIRYCLSKNSHSLTVFLWCLCQCCRERADHFRWDGIEADSAGLGLVLNVPKAGVEESITILSDAKLISVSSQIITVLHWEKHQSEYLSRRAYFAKRYNKSPESASLKSTVKHREALLEERRGDESTEYERDISVRRTDKPRSFELPQGEELKLYAATIGLPESETKLFTAHYESNGWMVGSVPMVSWRDALMKWKIRFDANRNNQRQNTRPARHVPNI